MCHMGHASRISSRPYTTIYSVVHAHTGWNTHTYIDRGFLKNALFFAQNECATHRVTQQSSAHNA